MSVPIVNVRQTELFRAKNTIFSVFLGVYAESFSNLGCLFGCNAVCVHNIIHNKRIETTGEKFFFSNAIEYWTLVAKANYLLPQQ